MSEPNQSDFRDDGPAAGSPRGSGRWDAEAEGAAGAAAYGSGGSIRPGSDGPGSDGPGWLEDHWEEEALGLADTVDVSSTVDELVVYLDGYLDDEQRRRVERRLLEDESARADLVALQSSWDALDALPRESCSVDFTESTMKLVVQRELASQTGWKRWRKWAAPVVVAAGLLLSLGMGFLLARQAETADEREFLESYRLIRDWEKYELLGDFDFLLRLEKEGLFTREVNHVAP